jgi:hypothetical protein
MKRILLATLFAAAFAGSAYAHEESDGAPACMVETPVTETLVRDAGMYDFTGFTGEGATPAFIMGGLSPTREWEADFDFFGTAVFLRNADGSWRAFLPRPGESVVGVYAAHESGAMILVTQWQSEGPGQSWTLLRSNDALATGVCTTVTFPDALNQPTWANETLLLTDLDIRANGRGELIGEAAWEREREAWFVFSTRDGGATWQMPPRRISRERQARAGLYTAIEDAPAPEALVAELRAYAAGR